MTQLYAFTDLDPRPILGPVRRNPEPITDESKTADKRAFEAAGLNDMHDPAAHASNRCCFGCTCYGCGQRATGNHRSCFISPSEDGL